LIAGEAMELENLALREKVVRGLLSRRLKYCEAAKELGVTPRTVHNYFHRFLRHGPEGLKDHRKGNHRKITRAEEQAIIACKQERPQRSARLIRDMLGLRVSEEAVRLVLVKHGLNRRALEAEERPLAVKVAAV
jgi:transposase